MFDRRPVSAFLAAVIGSGIAALAASPLGAQRASGYATTPDRVRLHYDVVGSGPTTVIVPGRLFLETRFRALASKYRVVFYDTRGRGLSDPVRDSARETIWDDVRDLETVREHVGAGKVALIGWSYMGLLVALYASRHAEWVTRVVQIDPVPMEFDATFPRELSEPYATGVDTEALHGLDSLRRAGYDKSHPREYCEKDWDVNRFALVGNRKNVARLTVNATAMCRLENEWPINLDRHIAASIASIKPLHWSAADLAILTMPFLTIHGTRDRNAPYGGGREWAIKLRNARLLTVRGAAHSSFDEYPEIVLPAVETFLRGAWPASAVRLAR